MSYVLTTNVGPKFPRLVHKWGMSRLSPNSEFEFHYHEAIAPSRFFQDMQE